MLALVTVTVGRVVAPPLELSFGSSSTFSVDASGGVSGGGGGGGGGGSGSGGVLGRHDPWRRGRWQLRTLRLLAACAAGRSPR